MKQEMMGWQWHQLDHMQIICITPDRFLQAKCFSSRPVNSVKALQVSKKQVQ